ncbi:MAG: outer membrane beta-barrel family protein [Flavobacteriaceae bacterium]|nr:outer membrane beta-barrel family protein [Flavobacteriaceae bacterium]
MSSTIAYSQTILGTITDVEQNNLDYSYVLIKDFDSTNVKEYSIARKGKYEIDLKKKYLKIVVEIQSNGYVTGKRVIDNPQKNKTYTIDFILEKDTTTNKLDEVIITAKRKPFKIKKDTVSYNVNSYRDGSERKIEDIIKKLPGIEVDKNTGAIKYKGKPIENVTLDGDNLFGHNYTLGTKNINVDMVEQIEAIENYSENPLLKGIEKGDKVSINLKLKKGKFNFSGNIDFGSGISENLNEVLDINANLLGITKAYKTFATLSYNNIGINRSPFNYFGFSQNREQFIEKRFLAKRIIPETSFLNTLDEERVNINNQYFGNYNALFKINKRLKIKTNLYYVNDKITSEQLFENQFIIDGQSFTTTDDISIEKKPKQYRGDLEVKYNASKTSLLEYNLTIQQENIQTPSSVVSNNDNSFTTLLNSESFYLRQKLLFTKKISDKKAFQFSVFQSTNNIPQNFQINPSIIDPINYENDIQKSEYSKNYLEVQSILLGSTTKKNKYTFSVGGIIDNNKLQSELFSQNLAGNNTAENGINNLRYSKKTMYQLGSYQFNTGKWKLSPSYRFRYLDQEIYNKESNTKNTQTNFLFEPSINIKYKLNEISSFLGTANYEQSSIVDNYLFQNQILINNRTSVSNIPSLELQEALSYGFSYLHDDLYNLLEVAIGMNYQNRNGNFFTNSTINQNTTQINYFFLPQDNNNLNFNFSATKYIRFLESTVKSNSNYSISRYKNIVNNSELRNNESRFFNTQLNFRTAFRLFVNFENTINFSQSISQSDNSNEFINESLNNTFKIILKPAKKWFVLLSSDYFLPNLKQKSENYMFLDASVRFRPKNKRLEFNLIAKNLLNETNFEQIQTSDFSTNIYRTNILPRYYMLNMSYDF